MTETPHEQLIKRLDSIDKRFKSVEDKLNPMYEIFVGAQGFNKISVWILKALILVGAGVGIVYGFIKYLKQ